MGQIAKIDRQIPIRSIPEEELNRIIIEEFSVWVAGLLSLTDEGSAEKLELALPAIKEHCWSMGFAEIKKMFELYADNKLSIEPRSNYFDRILFGKIVVAYKKEVPREPLQMPVKEKSKEEQAEEAEKKKAEEKKFATENVLLAYDAWEKTGSVPTEFHIAFDRLFEWGILPKPEASEKIRDRYHKLTCKAHIELVGPLLEMIQWARANDLEDTPKCIEVKKKYSELNKSYNHPEIQNRFRCLVLEGLFSKTDRETLIDKMWNDTK